MIDALLAATMFCSHVTTTEKKRECVYDVMACVAKVQREVAYQERNYAWIPWEGETTQALANCILIDMETL